MKKIKFAQAYKYLLFGRIYFWKLPTRVEEDGTISVTMPKVRGDKDVNYYLRYN